MRSLIVILMFSAIFLPSFAYAKRGPEPKVESVDYQGVRYIAHNDGRQQWVQALDIETGKALWEVTVFRQIINPLMEEDVQWVFIKQMFIKDEKLIVIDEKERAYSVNLKTHRVSRLERISKIIIGSVLCFFVAGWFVFYWRRRKAAEL